MPKVIQYLPRLIQVRAQYDPDPDTGNKPENILWFQSASTTALTLANLTTISGVFDTAWKLVWEPLGPSSKHYIGSIVTDFSSSFGLQYSSVGTVTPGPGVLTGACMPPNVAALISMKNGEHFKGGHFRIYLPYISITAQASDPSMLNPTYLTNVVNNFAALNASMQGSGVAGGQSQVLYRHRYTAGSARLDPITQFTVNTLLATQRRRLRKSPHK